MAANAASSSAATLASALGQADRQQLASAPVPIAAFKRSYAQALDRAATEAVWRDPPACAPDVWAAAAAACRCGAARLGLRGLRTRFSLTCHVCMHGASASVDYVLADVNRHFSGPVLATVLGRRPPGSPPSRCRARAPCRIVRPPWPGLKGDRAAGVGRVQERAPCG
jgi:hypothetical protein